MSEYLPSALYCEGQGITYCEMLNHPIMCNFTHAGCIGDNIRLNIVYRVHTHTHTHIHTHTHTHKFIENNKLCNQFPKLG